MLLFLLSLFVIIVIHEAAHLVAAKLCGCGVEVFSIGFGKPFYKKKIKGTVYQITPFLLGGYCKLKGELITDKSLDAFTNLGYTKKVIISLAGVAINLIIGTLTLFIGIKLHTYFLVYFGYLNIMLGICNLLPIPALDGSYPFMMLFEIFFGKERGLAISEAIINIFFKILIVLNILCLPWFFTVGIKMLGLQVDIIYLIFGG